MKDDAIGTKKQKMALLSVLIIWFYMAGPEPWRTIVIIAVAIGLVIYGIVKLKAGRKTKETTEKEDGGGASINAMESLIHIFHNNQQEGPYSVGQIEKMIESGSVAPITLAWKEGMSEWAPLNTILESREQAAVPPPPVHRAEEV